MATYNSGVVDEALKQLNDIATLPEVAQAVMAAADNPDTSAEDIEELVSGDAVLASRVLKVVNSSFYGSSGEIASIREAIVRLGLNAVKNIAVAASLGKLFRGTQVNDFYDARELWRHSSAVACAARLLAKRLRMDAEQAFLLGMLHDIGVIIEIQFAREKLSTAIDHKFEQPELDFRDAETEAIGANHEQFGEAFCRQWQFPPLFCEVVGHHHQPMALDGEAQRFAALLCVSDHLAEAAGIGYIGTNKDDEIPADIIALLGLDDEDFAVVDEELPGALALAALLSE